MLFNSLDFAVFLPVVFILYWLLDKTKIKYHNLLILISSYIFYGWWDYKFLFLIVLSTIIDFSIGLFLEQEQKANNRKYLLWCSLVVNLGLLGVFKYYNFFQQNFVEVFTFFGSKIDLRSLNIILPVGISFYTFQTLSYTIDIYNKKLEATKDFLSFAAFVVFFPQLVAGPIERATHLLPQFYKKRIFNYESAVLGMRLILWGFFQKIVIADVSAPYVNDIFNNYKEYSSGTLLLGAILFSFQIYGDFAGYSNIAIGTSRLFGFALMRNFKYPYFSRDIAEFWRCWHISLSTWFRDYLYIPLGGSRGSIFIKVRNVFLIFIISGFWHGANWTYIIWGALNAIYFLPLLLLKRNRKNTETLKAEGVKLKTFLQIIITFSLTTFAWIFFRSESVSHALSFIERIFINDNYLKISSTLTYTNNIRPLLISIIFLLFTEWLSRDKEDIVNKFLESNKILRRSFYFLISLIIILNINNKAVDFIYFQF